MRIYIDGVWDLTHRGHVEILKKAKEYKKDATLLVGVISDKDATDYKREPIYNEEDRYILIQSIKYVDEVIFNAPLIITPDFVNRHNIDLILHAFSDTTDIIKQTEFTEKVSFMFEVIPYYKHTSTSSIIEKIKNNFLQSK